MRFHRFIYSIVALAAMLPSSNATESKDYKIAARYPIGGSDVGYDYLRFDSATRRLFVSHASKVEVLDGDSGKSLGVIGDLQGAHGIAFAPELNRGFITSGLNRAVVVFALDSLKTIERIQYTGTKPDSIEYHAATKRIFVVNGEDTGDITVVDAQSLAIVATIRLHGGKLEQLAFDQAGHGYVNDEAQNVVHVFDAKTLKVVGKYSTGEVEEPTGISIDHATNRLFVVGGNNKMSVLDSQTGRVVATVPIGSDPDGVFFNPRNKLVFCSNRAGTLDVIRQIDADTYQSSQSVPTIFGCRTLAVDVVKDRIFLPFGKFGPKPAPTADVPAPRAPVLPGTFEVLVVGR